MKHSLGRADGQLMHKSCVAFIAAVALPIPCPHHQMALLFHTNFGPFCSWISMMVLAVFPQIWIDFKQNLLKIFQVDYHN